MIYDSNDKSVQLRPWMARDMKNQAYLNAFHDPEVTRFNSHGLFPYTRAKRDAFMEDIETGRRIVWKIKMLDAAKKAEVEKQPKGSKIDEAMRDRYLYSTVGNIALQSIDLINRSAELAIVIWDKGAWGKGIATSAVRLVLYHAFVVLGLNRVWTGTAEINQGMRKAAIKVGFKHEGTFIDGMWLKGEFVNVEAYGITRAEWEGEK